MSPPRRRRSARLATSTPKTPRRAPPSLNPVAEQDELPKLPMSDHDAIAPTPRQEPSTPAVSSSLKPDFAEMHPSHVHHTMAPPSSALRLGFADIHPSKKNADQPSGMTQVTPSKVSVPSSHFNFKFAETGDVGLSSRAQQMMVELREEAAKIRADLEAKRERELEEQEMHMINGRRIAKPRGKSSRYSAAHMAEFKKMDSIEGHASAFRALPGRFTPVTGLKRSSSRANLDDMSSVTIRSGIKRSPSKAKLDEPEMRRSRDQPTPGSPTKSRLRAADNDPPSPAKRFKQHLEDDASSSRPMSRDGSSIPRPKSSGVDAAPASMPRSHSTIALLSSPTKASAARAAAPSKPTISLVKSPTKPELHGMKKSATTNNLKPVQKTPGKRILSPRFERVKSILRGHKTPREKTGMPPPDASTMPKTPGHGSSRMDKALPPVPAPVTSPRNRLVKRVGFTPDSHARHAGLAPNSPSPSKSSIPRSKSLRNNQAEVHYPVLDTIMAEEGNEGDDEVSYPDLAKFGGAGTPSKAKGTNNPLPPSVPGTFTFRSDHTISFEGTSPTGFGGSPGQSSLRQVRPSILPIPGSFPASIMDAGRESKENKENSPPLKILPGISHGLENKKRHRVSTDEEDMERESADRAAKKQKNEHVPEGEALLAPRLMHSGSAKKHIPRPVAGGSSPMKKRAVLSLSRLNMLARPKNRR